MVRLPGGRSPRYALTTNAFGAGDRLPLYMVDPHGNNVIVAHLRPLTQGGFFIEGEVGMPRTLLGEGGDGIYDNLPYFLDDLRPQGFLGRQIAAEMANISPEFPADPRHWSSEHVGRYLISNGDDLPGNLKFGPSAPYRVRRPPTAVTPMAYPELAEAVMGGAIPGSSAGGEQPKFTAYNFERGHVIVKFSPPGNDSVARRWRDILITEFHATQTIHERGLPAAETRLYETEGAEGRLFLESQRFDRSGELGRLPMLSLQAIDAEFTGLGTHWPSVMRALEQLKLVNNQHVYETDCLWQFGQLINNSDMHLGNISLAIEGDVFRLLPLYDMCSMGFAPRSGEVSSFNFIPSIQGTMELPRESQLLAREMAGAFWSAVEEDNRISTEFRMFLRNSNIAGSRPGSGGTTRPRA